MSGHNWKPGDVARWAEYLGSDGLLFRTEDGWFDAEGDKRPVLTDAAVSRVARPLVVIDPEDREQVERLSKAMHESDHIAPWHDLHNETRGQIEDAMQAALREFAAPTPPKPDEPQGLGAVVEDAEGVRWLAVGALGGGNGPFRWARNGAVTGRWCKWSDIAVVRVLSEGVAQ